MNAKLTAILTGFTGIFCAAWLIGLTTGAYPAKTPPLWISYYEALNLSGALSIALMSLCMLLAVRPAWLEGPLGGMDRIYRLHKWTGIASLAFALLHWLIVEMDDAVRAVAGRPVRIHYERWLEKLRDSGECLGEQGIYGLLILLALTLWRLIPYHLWRHAHRAMPVIYLMLAYHSLALIPPAWWLTPLGWLLAASIVGGGLASVLALCGRIGRTRRASGKITALRQHKDITEITCRLDGNWRGHRPGQFAFLRFDWLEGAHPFTLASANRTDRSVTFCIKALGDFTRRIGARAHTGQSVTVEGPYGRFLLDKIDRSRRQIWVAGGMGIAPFLSWLEALQPSPESAPQADLHYCTRDREHDPFVQRLQDACAALPGIRVHAYGSQQGESLDARALALGANGERRAELWFCGPTGLAAALRKGAKASWNGHLRVHQEAFEMR